MSVALRLKVAAVTVATVCSQGHDSSRPLLARRVSRENPCENKAFSLVGCVGVAGRAVRSNDTEEKCALI